MAGDVDVPSLIQLTFFYLTHAKSGLSWDTRKPDCTTARWHDNDMELGSLLLCVPMSGLTYQREPLNYAVVQYHDQTVQECAVKCDSDPNCSYLFEVIKQAQWLSTHQSHQRRLRPLMMICRTDLGNSDHDPMRPMLTSL